MKTRAGSVSCAALLIIISAPQGRQSEEAGHSIGRVSVEGSLVLLELNDSALGRANLFDLAGRTLRFSPDKAGYRVENVPLSWESDYGPELSAAEAVLHEFAFPFSGKSWMSFRVGMTGSIRFGAQENEVPLDPYGHRDGGVVLDRFDRLAEKGSSLIDKAPAICVFLKPRLLGPHFVKELSDRVVVTWDLTEPFGGLLDFGWFRTVNRFQTVLHRDGVIEMSYKQLAASDAIVGVYPQLAPGVKPDAVDLSSISRTNGPFSALYEAFHHLDVPRPQDLSCTVIQALGDKFDFLAYYSDFRMDTQEASPPSDGPIGGNVAGIGNTEHERTRQALDSRCTQGRFQQGYAQPVFVGSNEAQAWPPQDAPVGSAHDITFFARQLAQGSPNGTAAPFNYAIGHLGHEVGHRWSAYAAARSGAELIPLVSWPHWLPGVQTRVAFPYSLPTEASTLGGGAWQDNFDGTYTRLRDGWFVPAAGYSYLDLYLMGLISAAEVPDFFVLADLVRIGSDANGHAVFKAARKKVTIQDVIAAVGPRVPDVDHSQRHFNTGIVVVVEHGRRPSRELIERAEGIRRQWMEFWTTATGRRASMTTDPR